MQTKKQPERMCLGCREQKNKKDLCRVVKDKEGNISFDATGKKSGRGAYVCKDIACLEKALKTKAFDRSLSVYISEETAKLLRDAVNNG
jgi:predicted RNA-binding protein YlxR (DUF448 family)